MTAKDKILYFLSLRLGHYSSLRFPKSQIKQLRDFAAQLKNSKVKAKDIYVAGRRNDEHQLSGYTVKQ